MDVEGSDDVPNCLVNSFDNCIGLGVSSSDRFEFEAIIVFDHSGEFCHEFSASVEGDSLG